MALPAREFNKLNLDARLKLENALMWHKGLRRCVRGACFERNSAGQGTAYPKEMKAPALALLNTLEETCNYVAAELDVFDAPHFQNAYQLLDLLFRREFAFGATRSATPTFSALMTCSKVSNEGWTFLAQ